MSTQRVIDRSPLAEIFQDINQRWQAVLLDQVFDYQR